MAQKRGRTAFSGWPSNPPSPEPEYSNRPPSSDAAKDMVLARDSTPSAANSAVRFG